MVTLAFMTVLIVAATVLTAFVTGRSLRVRRQEYADLEYARRVAFGRLQETRRRRDAVAGNWDLLHGTRSELLYERDLLLTELTITEQAPTERTVSAAVGVLGALAVSPAA